MQILDMLYPGKHLLLLVVRNLSTPSFLVIPEPEGEGSEKNVFHWGRTRHSPIRKRLVTFTAFTTRSHPGADLARPLVIVLLTVTFLSY